jgi:hypothetical protein
MAILFGHWAVAADTQATQSSIVEGAYGYAWGPNGAIYRKVMVSINSGSSSLVQLGLPVYGISGGSATFTFPTSGPCVVGTPGYSSVANALAANCLGFLAQTVSATAMAWLHVAGPGIVMIRGTGAATDAAQVISEGMAIAFTDVSAQFAGSGGVYATVNAAGVWARIMNTGTSGGQSITNVQRSSDTATVNAFIFAQQFPPGLF